MASFRRIGRLRASSVTEEVQATSQSNRASWHRRAGFDTRSRGCPAPPLLPYLDGLSRRPSARRSAPPRVDDLDALIERTDGVSPAFIKELLRKAAMVAAGEGADEQLIVSDAHVNVALDELLAETALLTRLLLGGATDRPPPTTMASMAWLPGAAPGVSRPELGGAVARGHLRE